MCDMQYFNIRINEIENTKEHVSSMYAPPKYTNSLSLNYIFESRISLTSAERPVPVIKDYTWQGADFHFFFKVSNAWNSMRHISRACLSSEMKGNYCVALLTT
jgi:hypothetical protein